MSALSRYRDVPYTYISDIHISSEHNKRFEVLQEYIPVLPGQSVYQGISTLYDTACNTVLLPEECMILPESEDFLKGSSRLILNALLNKETDELVNTQKYERSADRHGYRSSHYKRYSKYRYHSNIHIFLNL